MTLKTLDILAEINAPGLNVQLRSIPAPSKSIVAEQNCEHSTLAMTVGRLPGILVRRVGHRQFNPMGRVIFRPRNTPLEYQHIGRAWTDVVCRFDDHEKFERIVGKTGSWRREMVESSWNIQSPTLLNILRLLEIELRNPSSASAPLAEALATAAQYHLARYLDSDNGVRKGDYQLTRAQVEMIGERLEDVSREDPSMAALATLCGLSTRHFLRKFKNSMGFTVREYLYRSRLSKGMRLLSETHLPIKAVAYKLGFKVPGSFSSAFRNATSESPAVFRRRVWENETSARR
jgi:AraC family transcriptional regulator